MEGFLFFFKPLDSLMAVYRGAFRITHVFKSTMHLVELDLLLSAIVRVMLYIVNVGFHIDQSQSAFIATQRVGGIFFL